MKTNKYNLSMGHFLYKEAKKRKISTNSFITNVIFPCEEKSFKHLRKDNLNTAGFFFKILNIYI